MGSVRAILVAMFAVPVAGAAAQDQCKDILARGVTNTKLSIAMSDRQRADSSYYCSANFSEARDYYKLRKQQSSKADGGISYGPFGAKAGSANNSGEEVTEARLEQWKSENCGGKSSSQHDKEFQYLAQSQIELGVAQVWLDCMTKREGLSCWLSPQPHFINFNVSWTANSSLRPKVVQSFIGNGKSTMEGAPDGRIFVTGSELNPGHMAIPIQRAGPGEVALAMTLEHGGKNHACEAVVPDESLKPPVAPPSPSVAVRSIAKRDKFGCETSVGKDKCAVVDTVSASAGRALCRVAIGKVNKREGGSYTAEVTRASAKMRFAAEAQYISLAIGCVSFDPAIPCVPNPPMRINSWVFVDYEVFEVAANLGIDQRKAAGCDIP